jgi:hypothetical protein
MPGIVGEFAGARQMPGHGGLAQFEEIALADLSTSWLTSEEIVALRRFAKLACQFPSFRAIAFTRTHINCFPWSDKTPSPSTRSSPALF